MNEPTDGSPLAAVYRFLKMVLGGVPGIRPAWQRVQYAYHINRQWMASPFLKAFPPGHYHSPLPCPRDVPADAEQLPPSNRKSCPAIDLQDAAQLKLLDEFAPYYGDIPFADAPGPKCRYYYRQTWFNHPDAIVLYSVLRLTSPRRIIEVGSGFSSAVMVDTNELFLGGSVKLTHIEPDACRLESLLRAEDSRKSEIVRTRVQDVGLSLFDELEAGDLLFVDSSHVGKVGSDVLYILFEVLPRLRPGVWIHFHDIFWPFEYPAEWYRVGRAWTEAYLLRAFLQYNDRFRIRYFNSYMESQHKEAIRSRLPRCLEGLGSSLWLQKVPSPVD